MLFLGLTDAALARRLADPFRTAASAGALVAVCFEGSPAGVRRPHAAARERLDAVAKLLATLAAMGPILAATPGAEVACPQEALHALGADLAPYEAAFVRFGLARERQVTVSWDARATLRAFAERDAPELALARAFGRDRFGAEIVKVMASARERLAEAILQEIQAVARDALILPTRDDDQIAHIAAMLGPNDSEGFEAAMERIEAALAGEPRIGFVGPLPALSFAAIELVRTDAAHFPTLLEAQATGSPERKGALASLRFATGATASAARDPHPIRRRAPR